MGQTTPLGDYARQLVKDHPDANTIQLARMLHKKAGKQKTFDSCRSMIRRYRGNHGKYHRETSQDKTAYRENGKSGYVAPMPPSLAKESKPYEINGARLVGVLSDLHVPYHSEKAITAALDYIDELGIDDILINGDLADFYSVSFHEKDPSKRNLMAEIDIVVEFLEHLRERFPKQRIYYKYGNHEERWYRWLWNVAPELANSKRMHLHEWLELQRLKIDWIADKRPVMLGKLPVWHGHELPRGMTSPVNPARGNFMRTLDCSLVGHGHRSSSHTEPNWRHNETSAWSTGCLCDLTPDYAPVNKWNWGFATVQIEKDGSYEVTNLRIDKSGTVRKA